MAQMLQRLLQFDLDLIEDFDGLLFGFMRRTQINCLGSGHYCMMSYEAVNGKILYKVLSSRGISNDVNMQVNGVEV
jgi:hypothetical protein